MRSLALLLLAALLSVSTAQPTRPPTAPPAEQKKPELPAPAKAAAEIVHNPLGKVAALDSNKSDVKDVDATARDINRYLIVSGNGQYTLWANLAQIFVAVEPRIFQSVGVNATQQTNATYLPDDKAKAEIKAVYDKVLNVLQKYSAIDISSSPAFVSSPMFEPNVTAFRQFMQHQSQMMARRRNALAHRMGRTLLLRGRPLSMRESFVPQRGLMHRSNIHPQQLDVEDGAEPVKPEVKKEEPAKEPEKPIAKDQEKKDVVADKKVEEKTEEKEKEKEKEEPTVPLPDPKSLINFRGFRFYRPLSAMVPIESLMEIAQSLRAVNATIENVQLAVSQKAFDEARGIATKAAIERGLTVADAALNAAGEKRAKVTTVLINTSNPPHLPRLPMFRASFLRPQSVTVNSQVILRVTF